MAIYNEILVGRYARMLQKLFGIKGTVPVKQLAGEITTNIQLFNGAENRYLEGWSQFGVFVAVAASVGNNSAIKFRNPGGSNVIAVVTKISVSESVIDQVDLGNRGPDTDLAAAGIPVGLDLRGQTNSNVKISATNNFGTATFFMLTEVQPNVTVDLLVTELQEIPVLPGDNLLLATASTNTILRANFLWRERFLEDSERA